MSPAPLQRVNFFCGQVLTAEDLLAEQEYHRRKRQLLQRCLLGCRIVCGLHVEVAGEAIAVGAGLALDCLGREVHVSEPARIQFPPSGGSAYLLLHYHEEAVLPAPAVDATGCEASILPSRILETCRLAWGLENPLAGHQPLRSGWAACGQDHGITLARLLPEKDGWRLDQAFTRAPKAHCGSAAP